MDKSYAKRLRKVQGFVFHWTLEMQNILHIY